MQQQSVKPQPRWMAQYPQWPMWLAFGLLTACFIAFVVVFTVAVTRGLKFVEAARGDIMRDMTVVASERKFKVKEKKPKVKAPATAS